jgi:hypothetical protein
MKQILSRIEDAVSFICSAVIAALSVAYIACEQLDFSPEVVRLSALISAVLIGAKVLLEKSKKRK